MLLITTRKINSLQDDTQKKIFFPKSINNSYFLVNFQNYFFFMYQITIIKE